MDASGFVSCLFALRSAATWLSANGDAKSKKKSVKNPGRTAEQTRLRSTALMIGGSRPCRYL
jgi:hypothetical protein